MDIEFQVCDQSCGKHPANSGHPLSPCTQWGCEDDEDGPECYHDEDAIAEGNRCFMYCAWLNFMREMRMEAHGCTYPFCKGCGFIEITDGYRGRCRRDDDWTEYKGYEVWNLTKDEHLNEMKTWLEESK